MSGCTNCGNPKVHARGRCHACYVYRRRTGTDRPERLRIRYVGRLIERDLTPPARI